MKRLNQVKHFRCSDGVEYKKNVWGGFSQINPQRFTYNEEYNATYDTVRYTDSARRLNEIRWEMLVRALGYVPEAILDIGYGNASFLRYATEQMRQEHAAFWAHGFDIAPGYNPQPGELWERVESYRQYKYDVVCFWDSLEHMVHMDILQELKTQSVAISMPYFAFHDHTAEQFEGWHHRKPNEHLHFHNMASLGYMVRHFGYPDCRELSWPEDEVRQPKMPFQHNIMTGIFSKLGA